MTKLAEKILTWTENDIAKSGGTGRRLSKIFLYMDLNEEVNADRLVFTMAIKELVAANLASIEEFEEFGFVYLIPTRGKIEGKR